MIKIVAGNQGAITLEELEPEKVRQSLTSASLEAIDEIAPHLTRVQFVYCRIMLDSTRSARLVAAYEKAHPPVN